MSTRTKKIESLIQRELGSMLQRGDVHDPRIGFVTITKVDVSPDLRNAKVYVSVLGKKSEQRRSIIGIRNAKGFIQSALAKKIRLRYFPDLHFVVDDTGRYADEINKLLQDL